MTTPIYDTEITAPKLTVPGFATKAFTWNPTVASRIVSAKVPGVRKVRFWIHRPTATWRVQVAATPAGFANVAALVAETVANEGLAMAR